MANCDPSSEILRCHIVGRRIEPHAKLMASVAFGGGSNPDPDSAADDLRSAGYEVFRMPDKHPLLCHPLDDHIECVILGR